MSELAQVPAWFWIALGSIIALAGLVAGVWYSRDRAYRPVHRVRARDVVAVTEAEGRDFYGSMTLDGERALSPAGYLRGLDRVLASTTTTSPPPADPEDYDPELDEPFRWLPAEVAHGEPTAAEVAASRAAHGYIPELDEATHEWLAEGAPPGTCDWGDCDEVSEFWRTSETHGPLPVCGLHQDPGPGGAPSLVGPVPPGPDHDDDWDGSGPELDAWLQRQHEEYEQLTAGIVWPQERLADTGDIAAAHQAHPGPALMPWPFGFPPEHPERFQILQAQAHSSPACSRCGAAHKEPHCADGYEWGPWPDPGAERLAWLDQQLADHLEWARRMRGQVTGWGLETVA